jgi:hypothetical protein
MKDAANVEALVQPWRFSWVLGWLHSHRTSLLLPLRWAETAATA